MFANFTLGNALNYSRLQRIKPGDDLLSHGETLHMMTALHRSDGAWQFTAHCDQTFFQRSDEFNKNAMNLDVRFALSPFSGPNS